MEEQDNVSVNPSVETSEASCSDSEDVSSDTEDDSSDTEDDSSDDCPEVSGLWTQYCDQSTRQQESDDQECVKKMKKSAMKSLQIFTGLRGNNFITVRHFKNTTSEGPG